MRCAATVARFRPRRACSHEPRSLDRKECVLKVAVIDSGGANIASVRHALARLGHEGEVTTDPSVIQAAERVLLPGVGAAADAMARLQAAGLVPLIRSLKQPVLGICLGMQLLFEGSDEDGGVECLGILPGQARRFAVAPGRPVPHMGWNRVRAARPRPADIRCSTASPTAAISTLCTASRCPSGRRLWAPATMACRLPPLRAGPTFSAPSFIPRGPGPGGETPA